MQLAGLQPSIDTDGLRDEELVSLARRGVESAFRSLIKRNNQRLFRIARAVLRDDAEAEDAVQETYMRAFTKLEAFRGDSAFSTWLTRIALNEALGRLRRRRPSARIEDLDTDAASAGGRVIMLPTSLTPPGADAEAGRSQVRELLERAIDELPQPFRVVFLLRDVEEMSVEETAAQLALRPETVKTRLFRARRLMRTAIERRLSSGFAELFPFNGRRCERLADRVIERMRKP